jgi:hypothetical protein
VLSAPIIRSTIKTVDAIIGTVHVSVWCGLNILKDVQGRESISLDSEIDSQPWTSFSRPRLGVSQPGTSFNRFRPHYTDT